MYVLGIETSCDETGASVVYKGKTVCSNVTASSLRLHAKYGGIIPEIASRAQLEFISFVVDEAVKKARLRISDLGLIAVTKGPGLIGSLLVGISFAKALSFSKKIPILGIDHIQAHAYSAFLDPKILRLPKFPFVSLVVSGGHTSLFYFRNFNRFSMIGDTLDDAAGEAFDKVAKLLGFGYPGGPAIEQHARKGDSKKYRFSCGDSKNLDFSFSGIKTAVLYKVRDLTKHRPLSYKTKCDLAASFQCCVISSLVDKAMSAVKKRRVKSLVVGGGVIANKDFREKLINKSKDLGIKVFIPKMDLCTDNASMIAGLGFQLYRLKKRDKLNFKPQLY